MERRQAYENGRLLATVLAWRLKHVQPVTSSSAQLEAAQKKWNTKHDEFMRDLRARFPLLSDASKNYMGDPVELIDEALCGLRTFFHYNWGDGPVIQWYLGYHHRTIRQTTEQCTDCESTRVQYGNRDAFGEIDVLSDGVLMPAILLEGRRTSLEELVAATLNTDWYPVVQSCRACKKQGGMIERVRLVNLPLFLVIPIQRGMRVEDVRFDRELTYNPDRLKVGPTIDGMTAVYQLYSRTNYVGAHYTIDQRISKMTEPTKLMKWNFQRKELVAEPATDKFSRMLVWRRLPQATA